MVATGNVHCEMTDSSKKTQTIDCNRLTVLTVPGPDGKMVPRTINADGDVHTVDPDQDMHAGTLTVLLRPSTRPSTRPAAVAANAPDQRTAVAMATDAPGPGIPAPGVPAPARVAASQPSTNPSANVEVESMTAHDHVIVVTKDGTTATADQLLVNMVDGKARVKLLGSPTAKIVDKQSTVTGAIISLNPDAQEMTVDGEGEMHAIQQESPGAAPRPMDVFWSRSLVVNGKENFADAIGSVRALVNNADGSQDVAKGDHVRMLLADVPVPATRPAAQPAAQPAPTRVASTSPASQAATQTAGSLNLMGKKTVRQANFYDNAEVSSTLLDSTGGLLRRMDVFAPTIIYDVLEKDGVSQKKVTIPCAGRMLVEDYRQPAAQPAGQPANNNGGSSARGATAFQWSKKLIYDDATRQVVMEGSLQEPVMIDHREDVEKGEPVRLVGDTVVADLEPVAAAPKPATAKPAAPNGAATNPAAPAAPASNEPHFQIKKMTAHGHVLLTSRNSQLTADTMIYDPITHWLHAIGNDRQPALYTKTVPDQRGYQPISGDEMDYDTQDDAIKISKPVSRLHR
jgi:lipopolysaccharide export system protein LptA